MGYQPDVPGPGEDAGPNDVLAEASNYHIPDGEMAGRESRQGDGPRPTHELTTCHPGEFREAAEGRSVDVRRRTGTDYPVVRLSGEDSTEQRADFSADDLAREERFDPAQDDAGPQLD